MTTLDSQSDKKLYDLDKQPHVGLDNTASSSECMFPDGFSPLEGQVAGHPFDSKRHTIGLLRRRNGHVLKPATKAIIGEREIAFYETLRTSQDPTIVQLKNFVPTYYGTTELQIFDKRTKFLALKDITEGMAEPCVMDIKIGRRTWDPLATPEKRATEELKYAESKRAYGFCITGFQVYCVATGRLKKFDKDYGKKLDAKGIVEALETFLNVSPERPPCQQLIAKLHSFLWEIVLFFRMQRKYRFYSSSLLVAYDARRLRQHYSPCDRNSEDSTNNRTKSDCSTSSTRTVSTNENETTSYLTPFVSNVRMKSNTVMQNTQMLKNREDLNTGFVSTKADKISIRNTSYKPNFKVDQLCHIQSHVNNINEKKKEDCDVLLNEVSNCPKEKYNWVKMSMIDFTHVFPADDETSLDYNYLEGIENLFKLIGTFLVPEGSTK